MVLIIRSEHNPKLHIAIFLPIFHFTIYNMKHSSRIASPKTNKTSFARNKHYWVNGESWITGILMAYAHGTFNQLELFTNCRRNELECVFGENAIWLCVSTSTEYIGTNHSWGKYEFLLNRNEAVSERIFRFSLIDYEPT